MQDASGQALRVGDHVVVELVVTHLAEAGVASNVVAVIPNGAPMGLGDATCVFRPEACTKVEG